jgi:hypothetical protein
LHLVGLLSSYVVPSLNLCRRTKKCACIKCFYHELLITNTLYAFFWVIPRRLNFICYFGAKPFSRINTPTFSTQVVLHIYPPMKMEQTECSETSACKIQTSGNYAEESIQHSEHDEILKSRINQHVPIVLAIIIRVYLHEY